MKNNTMKNLLIISYLIAFLPDCLFSQNLLFKSEQNNLYFQNQKYFEYLTSIQTVSEDLNGLSICPAKKIDETFFLEAKNELSQKITQNLSLDHAYTYRAICNYLLGIEDSALIDINKAIRINPDLGIAYCIRGIFFMYRYDYSKAERDYKKAARLNPGDPWIFYNLGTLCIYKRDINKACYYHTLSLNIDSGFYDSLIELGSIEQFKKNMKASNTYFSRAIRLQPDNKYGYIYRGNMFYKNNMINEALNDYRLASELDPNNDYIKQKIRSISEK
jgi:tetratricopeptide (TPR) repeat protein